MLLTRIKVEPSLDEKGWAVRIGESHWRFSRFEFAAQFASQMIDEDFSRSIIEHAHEHDWERCDPVVCKGSLWQIIQGME